jgi:radical SAM protein with 4Fe4S-binding SPASM domain
VKKLAEVLIGLGVVRLGARRIVPIGQACSIGEHMLSPIELKEFYSSIADLNRSYVVRGTNFRIFTGCDSCIGNELKLYVKNTCALYEGRLITVMPDGKAMLCRRLPIEIGDVTKQTIFEIWHTSDTYLEVRNTRNAHDLCRRCNIFNECHGGAKCMVHGYYGRLFVPDPQCWKQSQVLLDKDYIF